MQAAPTSPWVRSTVSVVKARLIEKCRRLIPDRLWDVLPSLSDAAAPRVVLHPTWRAVGGGSRLDRVDDLIADWAQLVLEIFSV